MVDLWSFTFVYAREIFFLISNLSDEVIDDLSKIATWLVQETKSNGKVINHTKILDLSLHEMIL